LRRFAKVFATMFANQFTRLLHRYFAQHLRRSHLCALPALMRGEFSFKALKNPDGVTFEVCAFIAINDKGGDTKGSV